LQAYIIRLHYTIVQTDGCYSFIHSFIHSVSQSFGVF